MNRQRSLLLQLCAIYYSCSICLAELAVGVLLCELIACVCVARIAKKVVIKTTFWEFFLNDFCEFLKAKHYASHTSQTNLSIVSINKILILFLILFEY